ncbi:hypothetical protein NPIL_187721 [Nephila pilipes]|uniref:Uncharacterized protein n=1 Tax=Nephila pilipes TaxID=299642 RepID=A0A8X6TGH4_NEPPI|nr:hypothetical protein NPIL_187721 [Nephila pilipes]
MTPELTLLSPNIHTTPTGGLWAPTSKNRKQQIFLQNILVKTEPLRKRKTPNQCYRYQIYFRHSRFCTREFKCGDNHRTRRCTKAPAIPPPPNAFNCGGDHIENYSGCPKNSMSFKPSPSPTTNYWKERRKNAKNNKSQSSTPTNDSQSSSLSFVNEIKFFSKISSLIK